MRVIKVRNKNAMLELLKGGSSFEKITIIQNLDADSQTTEILKEASRHNVPIETLPFGKMAESRSGNTREVLVGFLTPTNSTSLDELLKNLYEKDQTPFFLLLNKISYESNIGVIARTAFAAGVNGLIFQGDETEFFNEETLHFSMGALARIPLVKMGTFEALSELKKNGIPTYAVHMEGKNYFTEKLVGPIAFVLGAEGEGLSPTILNHCEKKLAIPMRAGIDSLNVSTSAAALLYEKVRQEGAGFLKKQ